MEDRSAPSAKQAAANTAWNATAPFATRTIQKLPLSGGKGGDAGLEL
jgi:hypothetical protein